MNDRHAFADCMDVSPGHNSGDHGTSGQMLCLAFSPLGICTLGITIGMTSKGRDGLGPQREIRAALSARLEHRPATLCPAEPQGHGAGVASGVTGNGIWKHPPSLCRGELVLAEGCPCWRQLQFYGKRF